MLQIKQPIVRERCNYIGALSDSSLLYAEFDDSGVMFLFKLINGERVFLTKFRDLMSFIKSSDDDFLFFSLSKGDVFKVSSESVERLSSLPSGKENDPRAPICAIRYAFQANAIILNGENNQHELVRQGSWDLIEAFHEKSKGVYPLQAYGEANDVFLQTVHVDSESWSQVEKITCKNFVTGEIIWETEISEGIEPLGFHCCQDKIFIFSKRKTHEDYQFMGLTIPVDKYSGIDLGVMSVRDKKTGQEIWFNDTYIPNAVHSRPGVFGIVENAISHFALGHSFHYHVETGELLSPPDDLLTYMTSLRNKFRDTVGCAFGSYYFGIKTGRQKKSGQAVLYHGSSHYPVDAILDLDWGVYIQEAIPAGDKIIVNYKDMIGKEHRCYEFDFGSD